MRVKNQAWAVALLFVVGSVTGSHARAEVVESGANSLQVKEVLTVSAPPERVWQAFLQIGRWWGSDHTYSGSAGNLKLEPRAGGCWCETLPNGGGILHMTVVQVVPNQRMTLTGALGPLQTGAVAGTMTFGIAPKEGGSEITLIYYAGGYFPGGLNAVAPPVDHVLSEQLARLGRLINTGSAEPARPAP